jgi:fluoroacetyl-CoA thioesterase
MHRVPKVGETGELVFRVESSHTIDIADDPDLPVLSTPSLIWFLEHAARRALADILQPDETSVGVAVEVEHVAATPIGHQVTCVARIVHVDRALITFQVTAQDERELIARGLHKRRVVSCQRLREAVRGKAKR